MTDGLTDFKRLRVTETYWEKGANDAITSVIASPPHKYSRNTKLSYNESLENKGYYNGFNYVKRQLMNAAIDELILNELRKQ